jgi:hypothetical protein
MAVTNLVAMLPTNTRRAVLETLASGTNSWELFQAIGREYRVRDICVLGDGRRQVTSSETSGNTRTHFPTPVGIGREVV